MIETARQWSQEEFGGADLGDERRLRRLVQVGAQAAATPAGQLTSVFKDDAEREGAFRLVNNEEIDAREVGRSAHMATGRRCAEYKYVFIPVDGTSLNLTDTKRSKGLGVVGTRRIGAQGLKVLSALAVAPDGVPLGLCGQKYWSRRERSKGRRKHDLRRTEEKETQNWLDVMGDARAVLGSEAPETRAWFQIDREGDAWPLLHTAKDQGQFFTIRATHDRRLESEGTNGERRYLRAELERQPILGTYSLEISAKPERKAKQRHFKARPGRLAQMDIRASQVKLSLLDERSGKRVSVDLWALRARERQSEGSSFERIEWLLLTTFPVRCIEDARLVLFGYAQRWKIEEFHKAWKSGACRAEDTQLRAESHIVRWVTILASVAARIIRMTYLARRAPEAPATTEFSQAEIDAVLLGSRRTRHRAGEVPTISEIVFLLSKLGGYTGKSSGGPPGALVLARGLQRVQLLAEVLSAGFTLQEKDKI